MTSPFVIAVCGPTASGKTQIAFELAQILKAEIINFDSVQVYREVAIGSSQPPASMLKIVKHHLISEIAPSINFTAGDFRRVALDLLANKLSKSEYVILVGGTGFYLQALLKGMYEYSPVDEKIKNDLKNELREKGLERLFQELKKVDPESAVKIEPADNYRILRALEVWRGTGKKFSQIKQEFEPEPFPYPTFQIGIQKDRKTLREHVEIRTERMLFDGLINETRNLLDKYGRLIKPLQSVGYRESLFCLDGLLEEKFLHQAIVTATMQLAKRQVTWFRRDKVEWFETEDAVRSVLTKLRKFQILPQ